MAHRSARGVAAGAGGGVVCRGLWGVGGGDCQEEEEEEEEEAVGQRDDTTLMPC